MMAQDEQVWTLRMVVVLHRLTAQHQIGDAKQDRLMAAKQVRSHSQLSIPFLSSCRRHVVRPYDIRDFLYWLFSMAQE